MTEDTYHWRSKIGKDCSVFSAFSLSQSSDQ